MKDKQISKNYQTTDRLNIVVIGASGDLAGKKIFPALFALYCQNFLPKQFSIFGFARSDFGDDAFRTYITQHLTCRYTPGQQCSEKMNDFLAHCHYMSGSYDSADSYSSLHNAIHRDDEEEKVNHIVYLAIPPFLVPSIVKAMNDSKLLSFQRKDSWSRVIIEKPFGKDRESSDKLNNQLLQVLSEDQIYRIDHYLGKEVIQNLLVLRFANILFEPLWNRKFIKEVHISWKEDIGVEGREKYFDEYGIICDVMQNHLVQIMALIAMEPPKQLIADNIVEEKVNVLKSVAPATIDKMRVGQYKKTTKGDHLINGYLDNDLIPRDSLTPTFASATLNIENERWKDVPFILSAGKGLDTRMTEIRIKFKEVSENIFCKSGKCPSSNELVIRVQPDEALHLKIVNKLPGMELDIVNRNLDLQYKTAFDGVIPEAYESLLLDVIKGDKSLFIRNDELEAAWDIFSPALNEMAKNKIKPIQYEFGSHGELVTANDAN